MKKSKHLDSSLWIRFWGELLVSVMMQMIWPFLALYMHNKLGSSYTTIGLLLMWAPITAMIGLTVGGQLADKWGRRSVMMLSMFMGAVVMAGYAVSDSLWMFALCLIIQGLFTSMYDPAANAMVADVTPEEYRQEAYALLRIAQNVGTVIGPLMAMVLFFTSPTPVFFAASGILLAFVLVLRLFVPETLQKVDKAETSESVQPKSSWSEYLIILKDRPFLMFVLSGTIGMIAYQITMYTLPLHLDKVYQATTDVSWLQPLLGASNTSWLSEQLESGAKVFAFLLSMNGLLVVLLQMPIVRWVSKYPVAMVIVFGALLEAAGIFMLSRSPILGWLTLSFFVFTVGEMMTTPAANKLISDLSPNDMRGRYMATSSVRYIMAQGAAPLLGGIVLDLYGGGMVMLMASLVGLVSIIGYLLMNRLIAKRRIDLSQSNAA